jgi:hypothetical protein
MGSSSGSVYTYNTRLTEVSIWIHIVVQLFHIIKVITFAEVVPYIMMRITILKILKYQRFYKKFVFKIVGE